MEEHTTIVLKTIFDKLSEENKAKIGSVDWKVIDQNMASLSIDVREHTLEWMIKLLKQQERFADTVPALLIRFDELPSSLKEYVKVAFGEDTGIDFDSSVTLPLLRKNIEIRRTLTKLIEECEAPLFFHEENVKGVLKQ